ncbi:hypothetical protein KR032_010205 [Drosophila birchii]|nr:hypothetical protein KR032_010205 [Drosophila birchii]
MKTTGSLIALLSFAILANGQDKVSFLEPNCGVSILGLRNSRYRIIGGAMAVKYENPWMAFIKSTVECGGSLITARKLIISQGNKQINLRLSLGFVLSAAHCMTGKPTKVRLGEYDRETERDCRHMECIAKAQEFDVDATFVHTNYEQQRHDLALLRLAQRVQYTDNISPICVLLRPSVLNLEDYIVKFSVYGWGKTELGQSSRFLRKTTLYNLNRTACAEQYPDASIDRDHICGQRSGTSTCNGDSGGPLGARIIYKRKDIMILFGIVSFGGNICENATVFTNVMAHLDWIKNIVQIGETLVADGKANM